MNWKLWSGIGVLGLVSACSDPFVNSQPLEEPADDCDPSSETCEYDGGDGDGDTSVDMGGASATGEGTGGGPTEMMPMPMPTLGGAGGMMSMPPEPIDPDPPGDTCGGCMMGRVCCPAGQPCAGNCVPDCRMGQGCRGSGTCGDDGVCYK